MKNPESELISLELTNIANADSEINLFSGGLSGSSSSNTTTYYRINFPFTLVNQFKLQYTLGGVSNNYFTSPLLATIDLLIADLNAFLFTGLGYAFFSYAPNGISPNYTLIIRIINPTFIPTIFSSLTPDVSYPAGNPWIAISGTTVVISTGTNISYSELQNELQSQPYIINTVNVYANTQVQAMQRLKKTTKLATGVVSVDFNRPKVDPMQNQLAIEGIDTKFIPSPINAINYNMKALESVRMWFYYSRIDMSEINQEKFEEIIAPKTIEKIIIMQESINPLFDLVGETTSKKISIKEKVVSKVDFSDVTDEDVYNSFDGLDFKEL